MSRALSSHSVANAFLFRYINCCNKAFTYLYNSQAGMPNHDITPVTPVTVDSR